MSKIDINKDAAFFFVLFGLAPIDFRLALLILLNDFLKVRRVFKIRRIEWRYVTNENFMLLRVAWLCIKKIGF